MGRVSSKYFLIGELLLLLRWEVGWREILLFPLSELVSKPVLDELISCETSGHNGCPGGQDLLRVDGGVELRNREEVLEHLHGNRDRDSGHRTDNDDVSD